MIRAARNIAIAMVSFAIGTLGVALIAMTMVVRKARHGR
jgi:hypothetical protein